MLMFSVSAFVLFHFGLDRNALAGDLAAGVLWVTLLFAAVLGMNRLFVAEREQGGFDGVPARPGRPHGDVRRQGGRAARGSSSRSSWSRCRRSWCCCSSRASGRPCRSCSRCSCSPTSGSPWSGTLVGALGVQTRARDLIVPLIALPLLVPVVIGAAQATAPLLAAGGADALELRWLGVLALYDAVFGLLAYAVFDYLLED